MSISAKCRNCGRSYSVKDEHAGKKFRCQECQAAVSVPVPKVESYDEDDPWDAEDYGDDFGSGDDDGYEDYDSPRPAPARRRPVKKKKPAAKKKRTRKSSPGVGSEIGAAVGKIGGGLFVALVVAGFVFRVMNAGGFDFGGSWQSYTTPDGNVTVQMPGKVKTLPMRQLAPGGQSFGAERRSFACAIAIEPVPPELNGLSENEMFDVFQMGSQFIGISNVKRSTINGHACVLFDQPPQQGIQISSAAFVHKNKFYTLNFGYKGSKGNNEQKYFNSIQFR